jgi:Na+-driven multidrug efflux pump
VLGLPFSAMLLFLIVTWLALGKQRARELLAYFEIKQKTNIYLYYIFGTALAPIGIVSLLFLCRG